MDRPSRESCQKFTLRDVLGVEVRETPHGLGNGGV